MQSALRIALIFGIYMSFRWVIHRGNQRRAQRDCPNCVRMYYPGR